jgi:hypothetical protein
MTTEDVRLAIEKVSAINNPQLLAWYYTSWQKEALKKYYNINLETKDEIHLGIRFIELPDKVELK